MRPVSWSIVFPYVNVMVLAAPSTVVGFLGGCSPNPPGDQTSQAEATARACSSAAAGSRRQPAVPICGGAVGQQGKARVRADAPRAREGGNEASGRGDGAAAARDASAHARFAAGPRF
eukprot:COSAG03_NODE_810_length_5761_cov_6.315613_8_plen_117_part_01